MKLVKDPLLSFANALLLLFIGAMGFFAVPFALGGPAALIFKERIVVEFTKNGVADGAQIFPTVGFGLVALAALLALGIYFLVLLRRIVNSVGEGDPFAPVNARRLSRMGWTALAGQLLSLPVGGAVVWTAKILADEPEKVQLDDDFGFSGSGILLVLILFILARVFRKGAEMREELEGTV